MEEMSSPRPEPTNLTLLANSPNVRGKRAPGEAGPDRPPCLVSRSRAKFESDDGRGSSAATARGRQPHVDRRHRDGQHRDDRDACDGESGGTDEARALEV